MPIAGRSVGKRARGGKPGWLLGRGIYSEVGFFPQQPAARSPLAVSDRPEPDRPEPDRPDPDLEEPDPEVPNADRAQQWEVYYRGHVQGVGFRYSAVTASRSLEVSGYVRNLPDGRVHLVAEGRPEELERLLAQIARQHDGRIRDVDLQKRPPEGAFDGFEIR